MVVCHFTIIRDPPPPKTHGPGMDGIFLCFCMCVSKSFGRMHEGYLYLHVRDSTRKSSSRSILTLENKIVIFIIQPHYTIVFIIFLFVSLFFVKIFEQILRCWMRIPALNYSVNYSLRMESPLALELSSEVETTDYSKKHHFITLQL